RRCIYHDQSACLVASLARQHLANNRRVCGRIATAQVTQIAVCQSKILRLNLKRLDLASLSLSNKSLPVQRDLIKSVCAMDNPGAFTSERRQNIREQFNQVFSPNANHLSGRSCRITQRPQQIERGANAQL